VWWCQSSFDVAENFGDVSCTQCTFHRYDFELIPTVRIETTLSVEGSLGNFRRSIIIAELWRPGVANVEKK